MKLTIFQSDKGDCLLLQAASGERVLCDGGMSASMKKYVRDELTQLNELDLVYVSHIDSDHLSGVLQLLKDEVEWRIFDFQQSRGRPVDEPEVPRPPAIKGILHNGFRDQVLDNRKSLASLVTLREIENTLNALVPALFSSSDLALAAAAEDMAAVATSIPESLEVAGLIATDALAIPLNKPPGVEKASRLLHAGRSGDRFTLGSLSFTLLGPTAKELNDLRTGWDNWLRANREQVKKLREKLKSRIDEFSSGTLMDSPLDLRDWWGVPDFKGVTMPNVASLMFMVQEGDKTLLLTGDCQQDFIIKGLERTGFLEPGGHVRVNVLKVQHHGSENNMDDAFAERVSADHYVFCGNGEHDNPDLGVLDIVFNSRADDDDPYEFWFSTTAKAQAGKAHQPYFREVEKHARALRRRSNGRLTLHFNEEAGTVLPI